jgi:hypothetical protein
MRHSFHRFLQDECGSLLVTEWVFLASILVIALVPLVNETRLRVNQAAQARGSSFAAQNAKLHSQMAP